MKSICAFAPATIANINVGFDVLGLALDSVGDLVEVTFNGTDQNKITEIVGGADLPLEIEKNCSSVVIDKMQQQLAENRGVDIRIRKGIASGSGLGSSSASSAAAAFAFNELLNRPFSKEELVPFAAEGERIACGTAHLDNVAPAILGGLILIQNNDLIKLPFPKTVHVVSFFPKVQVKTADSRKVLPQAVPLGTHSKKVADMGSFVASLYQQDLRMFSNSLSDKIIEPERKKLIPNFDEMKSVATENDALAFGISGSGPSVFAFVEGLEKAESIASGLTKIFENTAIETQSIVESAHGNTGARIATFEQP